MQAGRWQQTRRRISAAHFQPSVLVTLRGIACREPWGESCIMLVLCHLLKLSHISIVRVEGHCSHQMDETNLDKHPLMPRKMHLFIPFPCFSYSLRIPLLRGNPIEPSAWWYRPFNDITIHHQQPSRGHGWNPAGPLETLPTKCPCPIMSMGHTSFFFAGWKKEALFRQTLFWRDHRQNGIHHTNFPCSFPRWPALHPDHPGCWILATPLSLCFVSSAPSGFVPAPPAVEGAMTHHPKSTRFRDLGTVTGTTDPMHVYHWYQHPVSDKSWWSAAFTCMAWPQRHPWT